MRILLVNPNTSAATTDAMVSVAREAAPAGVAIAGATAPFGASLITDEAALGVAGQAVVAAARGWAATVDGIIVAAFGDPGLEALRARVTCPVIGIAEAGMAEAAAGGRRFAVATTTPGLVAAIARRADAYGHGERFVGTYLTPGDPVALTADPLALAQALASSCRATARDGAEAVIIGGGPLALAARTIALQLAVPVVEPVPAAVRALIARLRTGT